MQAVRSADVRSSRRGQERGDRRLWHGACFEGTSSARRRWPTGQPSPKGVPIFGVGVGQTRSVGPSSPGRDRAWNRSDGLPRPSLIPSSYLLDPSPVPPDSRPPPPPEEASFLSFSATSTILRRPI